MELKNIFKMEMYKNRNNKPYLLVIAILTTMGAVATFWGIGMIEGIIGGEENFSEIFLVPIIIFAVIGLAAFSILYPFHLLNTDYKNKTMSLIFASGVSRERYYFVKIGTTILTCLIAFFVILFIPIVAFIVVYTEVFVGVMRFIFDDFTVAEVVPLLIQAFLGILTHLFILTTSVIITRGKVAGIFLYFGFLFALSIVQTIIVFTTFVLGDMGTVIVNSLFSIVQIVGFALLGLYVLRKQDL